MRIFLLFLNIFQYILCIHIHNISTYHSIIITVRYNDLLPSQIKYPLWFNKYPHIIYNRGKGQFPPSYNSIDILENSGREGFVYLMYIYDYYYNLPNITIFSQYDHINGENECPDVTEIMKGKNLPDICDGYASVGRDCLDDRVRVFIYGYERWARTIDEVKKQQETLLGPNFSVDNPRYIPTAFYAVTREAIHRNPRSFYRKLAQMLGSDEDPWQGHFIERSWPEIYHAKCGIGELFCCKFSEPHCSKEEKFVQLPP